MPDHDRKQPSPDFWLGRTFAHIEQERAYLQSLWTALEETRSVIKRGLAALEESNELLLRRD